MFHVHVVLSSVWKFELQVHAHTAGDDHPLSHVIGTFTIIAVAFAGVHVESHGAVLELLIQVSLSSVWYPLSQLHEHAAGVSQLPFV